jgi:hypothetical protein
MTDEQIEQAEKDAESDAKWLLLMLLLKKGVTFDAEKGRFYVDGKSVSITTIRNYLQRTEKRLAKKSIKLLDELKAGRITVERWQEEFSRNITSAHILAGAMALGSIKAAVNNVDVQERIDSELAYANNFASDLKEEVGPRANARATSYFMAAAVTYGILEMSVRKLMGKQTEAMRIRRASESCVGCIEWSYEWMPIEDMPEIGSLDCGGYCRCYIEYR